MNDATRKVGRRSWPRRMLNRMEVDQAVFFAILVRAWQFVAGPVTVYLIAKHFTGELQGYYYTFWSLINLQIFFEMSFHNVVFNVASHEWSHLSMAPDRSPTGNDEAISRLASLTRIATIMYAISALAFALIVGIAGLWFFRQEAIQPQFGWRAPWIALVVLTSLAFWLTPFLTLLEGCNQVKQLYQFQFIRAVLGNLAVWVCIPFGASLWVPSIASGLRLVCELTLICVIYRRFFGTLLRSPKRSTLSWQRDVWPFQWRMLLKSCVAFFNTNIINPVIFHYHGPVAAGQMGMTWQVLTSLQSCLRCVDSNPSGPIRNAYRAARLSRTRSHLLQTHFDCVGGAVGWQCRLLPSGLGVIAYSIPVVTTAA
ncbi:MAG: hypothetical protein R3C05_19750 [Pirellulaceae bacterium]